MQVTPPAAAALVAFEKPSLKNKKQNRSSQDCMIATNFLSDLPVGPTGFINVNVRIDDSGGDHQITEISDDNFFIST